MRFRIYQDSKGEWRWRLVSESGRVIADASQSYDSRSECLADIEQVKASAGALVEFESGGGPGTSSGGPHGQGEKP